MTSVDTKKSDVEKSADLTLPVKEIGGKTNGTVELPAEIFGVTANIALMHQVVIAQLAAARQGTHSTKTRGEVSGGGKKPYRQKEPVAPVRARPVRRSSQAVAPCTAHSRATTASAPRRR